MYKDEILIIPEKADIERDAVADVWQEQGGKVLRLGKFWQPPELDPCKVHVYGNHTFCLVLQQKLKLKKNTHKGKPKAIIANTLKGRGVPGLENESLAHIMNPKPELIDILLENKL